MYASDLTHKKRAAAIYRNLQLQKEWFATGATIRILGQKGGNDYSYLTQLEEGCIQDKCWIVSIPLVNKAGNSQEPVDLSTMTILNTDTSGNLIYDYGYGPQTLGIARKLGGFSVYDDANIKIPMGGMNFFFNGTNHGGASGHIYWNTNGAITFGQTIYTEDTSLSANKGIPSILIANYDRLTTEFAHSNYNVKDNMFKVTKIVVSIADYYTDTTNLTAGKYQIRLIKELNDDQRQWIEVSVISAPLSPGYSNNPAVIYPSGTQKDASGNIDVNQDSNGLPIDATKSSPWNITNGTSFLNPLGSMFSTAHPVAGTTILFYSDKEGRNWNASPNAYLNAY